MAYIVQSCRDCDQKDLLCKLDQKIEDATRKLYFAKAYLTTGSVNPRKLKELNRYRRIIENLSFDANYYCYEASLITSKAKTLINGL